MSKSPSILPAPAFDDPKRHLRMHLSVCPYILGAFPESCIVTAKGLQLPRTS